ncbi:peptidylprolyl isomerase [Pendulispora rubella]|uniref:Peptidyl-prolyl cis-trans isomerase n=1 Tax=Pendulispora rubella TaxID=2741070 RepID=A0ABZ2L010_9BACT
MAATIQADSYATVAYTLKTSEGVVIDGSSVEGGEPIQYVHGYGTLVPGLEAALEGLKAGDAKEIVIPADEGFGERDEDLVLIIDRTEFPDPAAIELGDEFVAEFAEGEELAMRVVEIQKDVVRVDANHPLAGVDLHYSIKVEEVRDATPEEIEQARAEQEDDEEDHEHGPDCDHDHDEDDDEEDEDDLDEEEEDEEEEDEKPS